MDIDRALIDERLLGAGLGNPTSWAVWLAVLRAAFGLPLDEQQQAIFASVAGERSPPTRRVRELWAICGRRSGKSRIAAAVAIFLALFIRYTLARGERGMVLVIAGSIEHARMVFDYIRGYLEAAPALQKEVASVKRYEIELHIFTVWAFR
jgi:phage terminase large subunit-like protein